MSAFFGVQGQRSKNFPAVLELSSLNGTDGFMLFHEDFDSRVGHSVSSAGDVNRDGISDFLIGASRSAVPGKGRAHCHTCQHDFLIAYSCKGRGVCPSCNSRYMVEVGAHLVENVLPKVPVRQWVISFPKRIRPYFKPKLCHMLSHQEILEIQIFVERKKASSLGACR